MEVLLSRESVRTTGYRSISCSSCRASTPYMDNRDSITNSQTPYMGSKDFLVPASMNSLFVKMLLIPRTCMNTTEACSRQLTWIDCLFDNNLNTLYLINPVTNSQTPYLQATETNKKKETDLLILRQETFEQRSHRHWPATE